MFIIINNKVINIQNIKTITVDNHSDLLRNLSNVNANDYIKFARQYSIDETQEVIKNNLEPLITFKTTFRIVIHNFDGSYIYSKSNNFYTEIEANNKMKELCLTCNKIEASLPKINI